RSLGVDVADERVALVVAEAAEVLVVGDGGIEGVGARELLVERVEIAGRRRRRRRRRGVAFCRRRRRRIARLRLALADGVAELVDGRSGLLAVDVAGQRIAGPVAERREVIAILQRVVERGVRELLRELLLGRLVRGGRFRGRPSTR